MRLAMGDDLWLVVSNHQHPPLNQETGKTQPFHDEKLQQSLLPLQKLCMPCVQKIIKGRPRGRSGEAHDGK